MTAIQSAYSAFRFSLANPADGEVGRLNDARIDQYRLGWNAYTNNVFNNSAAWKAYAEKRGLYQLTRPMFNPVTRLVDFYASHIYQGTLSTDGASLEDGQLLAIPLEKDTPPEITLALGQIYQWSNWAARLDLLGVYGASMGDVAIEVVEDVDKGKVWQQVVPASFITDYQTDAVGNIISYTKQYRAWDDQLQRGYDYKKVVTKSTFREYKDNNLHDFGNGAEYENIFGFAPLGMIHHRDRGTNVGEPAVTGWEKIESLNSLASRLDVGIRVKTQSPTVVVAENLKMSAPKVDATKDMEGAIKLFFAEGSGATVVPLDGNLDIPGTMQFLDALRDEIEADHPEITYYTKLLEMQNVTGPGADRLQGNVKAKIDRARVNYDSVMKNVLKMCLTMGGVRANDGLGGWMNPTDAQKKFLPFNLNSYERGDLDFEIVSMRPLSPRTKADYWDAEQKRLQAIQTGILAGEPLEWQEKRGGMTDDEWQEMQEMQQKANAASMGDGFPAGAQ